MSDRGRDQGPGSLCERIAARLDEFVASELSRADAAEVEAHLATCRECRHLADAIRTGALALAAAEAIAPGPDLAAEVLDRTTGPACRRAGELLCDFVDDSLAQAEASLVRLHLGHCADCGALAATIASLAIDLPQMAAIEPGPGFTADVLSATTGRRTAAPGLRRSAGSPRRPAAGRSPLPRGGAAAGRMAAFLARLPQRPRFALEGAYIGAVLLSLALGTPLTRRSANLDLSGVGPGMAAMASSATATVGGAARWAVVEGGAIAGRGWNRIDRQAREILDGAAGRARATKDAVRNGLAALDGSSDEGRARDGSPDGARDDSPDDSHGDSQGDSQGDSPKNRKP